MSDVLQTNIFFIITSVAVVIFTIFSCVALYYLIRILRNVRDVTDRLRRGSEQLAEDAQAVRTFIHEGVIGSVRASFGRIRGGGGTTEGGKRGKKIARGETADEEEGSY